MRNALLTHPRAAHAKHARNIRTHEAWQNARDVADHSASLHSATRYWTRVHALREIAPCGRSGPRITSRSIPRGAPRVRGPELDDSRCRFTSAAAQERGTVIIPIRPTRPSPSPGDG